MVKRGSPNASPPPGATEAVNFIAPATLNRVQHQTTAGGLLRAERLQPNRLFQSIESRANDGQRDEHNASASHIYDLVKGSGSDWMVM